MQFSSDVSTVIFVSVVLLGVISVFIWICIRVRRGGGSMTTIAMGATDGFLSKDQSKAVETVVEQNAGKRQEAQGDYEPHRS